MLHGMSTLDGPSPVAHERHSLPTASAGPGPTPAAERSVAIDALRGLVLLGILFMNMPTFALPHWAWDNPALGGAKDGIDWWAWFGSSVLWDGKMRALFSMLFGAGVVLLTGRAEASGPEGRAASADIYYRRMLWLMAFGIIDGYLLAWPGDILYWYGLIGLFMYPLRKLKARTLITAALCLLLIGAGLRSARQEMQRQDRDEAIALRDQQSNGAVLTEEGRDTLKDWEEGLKERSPPPAKIEKEISERRGGYFSVVKSTAPLTFRWNSEPPYIDFDVIPMMILGLGFAKAGVITGRRANRFYALLASCCIPLGWFVASLQPLAWSRAGFDPEFFTPWSQGGGWGYITQRLLLALGYLGVVMLAARTPMLSSPMRAIAAAGRMPLTNYLSQSVICLFIFSGLGLGLFAKLTWSQLILLTLAIWVPQVIFSVWWMNRYAFGPMEWLWRWLAYRKRPAWRLP